MTDTILFAVECPTERAVLRTLLYFEIFSYPLTAEEVFQYCDSPGAREKEIAESLQNLVRQGFVFHFGSFFQTKNHPDWVAQRLDCNRRAEQFLPIARRMARFIGRFPYIRAVFISGSLSKRCMRADSDVDFFLVTAPGRLWLARTLLVIFKKIFLLNSHKYFCVNYFIDTAHLEIEEKNLFTATEVVTLLPMYGKDWYRNFCMANNWAWKYYPHFSNHPAEGVPLHSKGFLKSMFEWVLNGKIGAWLDARAMRLTVGFWKKKFKHMDENAFELALKSRQYVSKHHPLHFQEKVLDAFAKRVKEVQGL